MLFGRSPYRHSGAMPTKFFRERVSWAHEWVLATGTEITRSASATRLDTEIGPR